MAENKPATLPRWSTDMTNMDAPSSGQQDTGWTPGQVGVSDYDNWKAFWAYKWCYFIDKLFGTGVDETLRLDSGNVSLGTGDIVSDQGDLILESGDINAGGHEGGGGAYPKGVVTGNRFYFMDGNAEQKPLALAFGDEGNARFTIDWRGFPTGQISVWDEHWKTTGTSEPTGWTWGTDGNGTRTYSDPIAEMPYRHVQLNTGTIGGTNSSQLVSRLIAYTVEDCPLSLEFDVYFDTTIDAGDALKFSAGLVFDHGGGLDRFIQFYFDKDVNANWRCQSIGAATINNDSGIAIAASATYRMRIDITYDSGAGHFLCAFWINGGLVQSFASASTPGLDAVGVYFNAGDGTGSSYNARIGHTRVRWAHRQTPDWNS